MGAGDVGDAREVGAVARRARRGGRRGHVHALGIPRQHALGNARRGDPAGRSIVAFVAKARLVTPTGFF
jgi:hypothetical protein